MTTVGNDFGSVKSDMRTISFEKVKILGKLENWKRGKKLGSGIKSANIKLIKTKIFIC